MQKRAPVNTRLKDIGKEIGSTQALAQIVTEFYERMSQDTMIGFFFVGKDLRLIAERQTSFLAEAFGLSTQYSGLPPHLARHSLAPILSGHFDRRLMILKQHLETKGFSKETIETWVEFEAFFRNAVQKKEDPR